MKKQHLRILLAVVCFGGFAVAAKAQARDQIAITLPHEFVVSGKTFPAGRYIVSRIAVNASTGVILSSYENRTSVVVLPSEVDSTPPNHPSFSLKRVGDVYFPTKIETANYVYTIPVPRSAVMEVAVRPHESSPVYGTPQASRSLVYGDSLGECGPIVEGAATVLRATRWDRRPGSGRGATPSQDCWSRGRPLVVRS